MYIVVYAEKQKDAEMAMRQVYDEILKEFKGIMHRTHRSVIDIGPFIRIDFRCGDPHRMSGLCCNYYYNCDPVNDDTSEVEILLGYSAARVNGHKLLRLEDIHYIVRKYFDSRMMEVNSND